MTTMKIAAQPSRTTNATMCCCCNDEKSCCSRRNAGGAESGVKSGGGGGGETANRFRIAVFSFDISRTAPSKHSATRELAMWAPVHLGGYAAAAKKENASTFEKNKSFERLFTNKTWNMSQARWLLILNIAGAALHAILAIVLLILAGSNGNLSTPNVTIYTTELSWNEESPDPFAPTLVKYGSLSLSWTTFSFFLLSSLAHTSIVLLNWHQLKAKDAAEAAQGSDNMFFNWYLTNLALCHTPCRWFEYFFSSSVMILLIAIVGGITHLHILILLFFMQSTTILFGLLAEMLNRPTETGEAAEGKEHTRWEEESLWRRLLPHLLGWIPQVGVWTVILMNFFAALNRAAENDREVPGYVYAIVFLQLLLFLCFAAPQIWLLSEKHGPVNFWRGELAYVCLSLVCKAVLGITFTVATYQFDRFEVGVTAT